MRPRGWSISYLRVDARRLASDSVLFRAGEPGDGCYRLEQGLVKVVIASPLGEERILTILGPGAIVGELSMIDGLPRSASVVAVSDCTLSFVSRGKFESFMATIRSSPDIW